MNSQPISNQRRFIEAVVRGLLIGAVLGGVFLAGFILRLCFEMTDLCRQDRASVAIPSDFLRGVLVSSQNVFG